MAFYIDCPVEGCPKELHGESKEEVMEQLMRHSKDAHIGMSLTPEEMEEIREKVEKDG